MTYSNPNTDIPEEHPWTSAHTITHSDAYLSISISIVRPYLFDFDCGIFSRRYTYYYPDIKVAYDDTWDDFGRAYFESRNYQFTGFHCTLCSVDEIQQKIESWLRECEQNSVSSDLYNLVAPCTPGLLTQYLADLHLNEDFCTWIDGVVTRNTISRDLWKADAHSCFPYKEQLFFQHQLVKLSLSGAHPQSGTAARPCCRSFLMASRRQPSGDDLLGH